MHLSGTIGETYSPLIITQTEAVFDKQGKIVAWKFKNFFDEKMILQLEQTATECNLGKLVTNVRGSHIGATFGSLIERGGSGEIHHQQHTAVAGEEFLNRNDELIQCLSFMMSQITPTQAFATEYIPKRFTRLGNFTTAFWNRTPISEYCCFVDLFSYKCSIGKLHKDPRDWFYCWIVPFGDWTGGDIVLTYNNIRVCTGCVCLSEVIVYFAMHYRLVCKEEICVC